MKIKVVYEKCEGHGLCEMAAPGVYQLDDEGEPQLLVDGDQVPAEFWGAAAAGAQVCPVAAIRIVES